MPVGTGRRSWPRGWNDAGAAVVSMPTPRSMDPPTLLGDGDGLRGSFARVVRTYGIVPYRDIDPTIWAGIVYVAMFGMMFGDVGHGLLLVAGAVLIQTGWIRRFPSLKPTWMFVAAAGLAAMAFGVLYGEFFGPTGVVPVVWLGATGQPLRLLFAALAVGAVLLGIAYAVGAVNRWREGGVSWRCTRRQASRVRSFSLESASWWPDTPSAQRFGGDRRRGRRGRCCACCRSGCTPNRAGARRGFCRRRSADSTLWCGSGRTWCRSLGSRLSA